MKRKPILTVVGIAPGGHRVVAGAHVLTSTYGLPLDLVLDRFKAHDILMDVQDFVNTSLKSGEGIRSITTKLDHAYFDVYGKEFRDNVIQGIEEMDQ